MTPGSEPLPTASHWGHYWAERRDGRLLALHPAGDDPEPSPIAAGVADGLRAPARLTHPLVRRGYLENGPGDTRRGLGRRGAEAFVPVDWEEALGLVAGELDRVRTEYGNESIFGGSYGWGSAGRFHHAQSQVHRFLNAVGGYTRSVDSYSNAALYVIARRAIGSPSVGMDSTPTWREVGEQRSLVLAFGGLAPRNVQVNPGGVGRHESLAGQRAARRAGAEFVSFSPMRDDADEALGAEWVPLRPGSDVAVMLGLAHCLVRAGAIDHDFLRRCTVGWERFADYLDGGTDGIPKDVRWAAERSEVPSRAIESLAERIAGRRTVFATAYSVQRADHGEQVPWMAVTLAAATGNIGVPGGGFGFGLGAMHHNGLRGPAFKAAALPQGRNPVSTFIPVARIADLLTRPGEQVDYDGHTLIYPDTRLVYWAGGNPFHHHQDLNRLAEAWQRPETIVVHEHFATSTARHADIVLPVATWAEREDFTAGGGDPFVTAMARVSEPPPGVLTDYDVFAALADRLGAGEAFTEGRDAGQWVRHLYEVTRANAQAAGLGLPEYDELVACGQVELPVDLDTPTPFELLRRDPEAHPLATPSGRIEIYSETVASFGYDDCAGHPRWYEPREWLGSATAASPLHLVSGQPARRLHSQYDHGAYSRAGKVAGREPMRMSPADAEARGLADGDVVRVFNARGACLAGLVVTDDIRPGVVSISTGAWYDPQTPGGLDLHGNPNVLTADRGTSRLAQGSSAHSCLVQVERYVETPGPLTVFDAPPTALRRSAGG